MKRPGNASAFPGGERGQGPRHRPFVNAAVRPRHWLVGRSEPMERMPSMKPTSARTGPHTGVFLAISALLAPASALAQQAQAEPQAPATEQAAAPSSATELDAVEVRGEYIPEPKLASPAIMTHVSKQDLERQGDSTAADALARVAGIKIGRAHV